ncbi:MAG: hypothetical protein L0H53_07125 [Candidatus Nitrosocosmicus sp.]|nr:hypothetical protein [Candidatus Nitrosocosmicus sp.]MDN5867251.1 hypothetical protein [Candidatus Nitrosocosmicus sp.]
MQSSPIRLIIIVISLYTFANYSISNDSVAFASTDIEFTNVCIDITQCEKLAVDWWKWAYGSTNENNPILDTKGVNCASGQTGSTWFLAGFFETNYQIVRDCTIPSDKIIFFPIINSECNYLDFPSLETDQELIECAKQAQDKATNLVATLNGTELPHVRVVTDIFNFTIPTDSPIFLNTNPGTYESAGNGAFVGIEGLKQGNYKLKFSGTSLPLPGSADINPFSQDITYNLRIE